MKINRLKRAQSTLTFYKNNYGFRPPYKILIDKTFCNLCIKLGFDLEIQLTKYLQSDVLLFTTRCVIKEMEKIGDPVREALKLIKTFKLTKCVHSKLEIRPAKCFLSILNHQSNDEHFFVATQNIQLLKKLENKETCPVICTKLNAIFLNKPPQISKNKAKKNLDNSLVSDYEINRLKEIKMTELDGESKEISKKKRKIRGPHPLSCRKKQIKLTNNLIENNISIKKRRKHKKNKISKHIRRLLKRNNEISS